MTWRTVALAFCAGIAGWVVSAATYGWWGTAIVTLAVCGAYIVGCADMYAWEEARHRREMQ